MLLCPILHDILENFSRRSTQKAKHQNAPQKIEIETYGKKKVVLLEK